MESKAKSRGQKRKAEESPATPSQMPAAKQVGTLVFLDKT